MPILTPEERLGEVVADRYVLRSVLGQGGMGVVFEAEHRLSGRRVALKMLLPEHALGEEVTARFLREARAAGQLEHPNVVEVLDVGVLDDGAPYLVLELLRGEPLADYLERKGSVSVERALTLMLPVMDALAEAHRCGIIHRDLKPDNVFLARLGDEVTPKLLDFGIAKVADDTSTLRTRTGLVMGTPAYMAPEQARGERDIGPAVDQWALGVMLFEAFTGSLPFDGPSFPVLIGRILTQEPPRLAERSDLPSRVASCVDRALSKDPADRHETVADFALALRRAAEAEKLDVGAAGASRVDWWSAPPPADPEEAPREPRHPSSVATVAAGGADDAMALGPTLARSTPSREPEPPPVTEAEQSTSTKTVRWIAAGAALLLVGGVVVLVAGGTDEDHRTVDVPAAATAQREADVPSARPADRRPETQEETAAPPAETVEAEPLAAAPAPSEEAASDEDGDSIEETSRGERRRRPRTSRPVRPSEPRTVEPPAPESPERQPAAADPMELRGW